MQFPLIFVTKTAVNEIRLLVRIERDLHGRWLIGADEQRFFDFEIFHGMQFVGEQQSRQSNADFAVTGAWEYDAIPERMVLQIAVASGMQFVAPRRLRRAGSHSQQRVIEYADPVP